MRGSDVDITLAVIFLLLAVVFFAGKGMWILQKFNIGGTAGKEVPPEKKKKYLRAVGVFFLVLSVNQALTRIMPPQIMSYLALFVPLLSLIFLGSYLKKL